MQRKVKQSLTFLTALVMVMSLICGSGFSVMAEATDTSGSESAETGEALAETFDESGVELYQGEEQGEELLPQYEESEVGIPETETGVPETFWEETEESVSSETDTEETGQAETSGEIGSENGETESEIRNETETETGIETGNETETETGSETETETETMEEESETEEQETEEKAKPEFTYNTTVNGVNVNIHAPEGILPEGTTVTVEPLAEDVIDTAARAINDTLEEREVVQIIGFDITFFDDEGNEMHNLDGEVSIEYSGMEISEKAESAQVYHADENGNITSTLSEEGTPSGTVGFTSDEFSPVLYAVTARAAGRVTANIHATISNGQVAYFYYNEESDVTGSVNLIPIADGESETIYPFRPSSGGNRYKPGYLVFFVKPDDNYLLTGLGEAGNNDLYSIDGPYGNISGYPGINTLAAYAKTLGYVGVFGYSRVNETNDVDATFVVNCQSPDIAVEAVSDKTENVKPGDELTFTVTITPGTTGSGKDKVSGVEIDTITVNGGPVTYTDIKSNGDGTYTTQVTYTATAEDCAGGSVKLDVTASVSYTGTLGVSDGQTLSSVATIEKSASTECLIAPQNQVTYTHTYDSNGVTITEYPDEITGNPVDSKNYYKDDLVTVDTSIPDGKEVEDTVNGGIWSFDGWYLDGEKVTQAKMTEEGLVFTGIWKFTPKFYSVVIEKIVAGNMGDQNKTFHFTAGLDKGDLGDDASFELSHGEKKTLYQIKSGTKLTVTEEEAGYVSDIKVYEDENLQPAQASSKTITIEVKNDMRIVFTNTKDAVIDTGVMLDSLPYILLLAVVLAGGVLFIIRRRRNYDAD